MPQVAHDSRSRAMARYLAPVPRARYGGGVGQSSHETKLLHEKTKLLHLPHGGCSPSYIGTLDIIMWLCGCVVMFYSRSTGYPFRRIVGSGGGEGSNLS